MLLLVFLCAGIVAYLISGDMGIEERFIRAAGMVHDDEEDSGFFGFNIEGNLILYIALLMALAIVCFVLYKRYKL